MFELNNKNLNYTDTEKFWNELHSEIDGMLVPELIPNLANISASIFNQMPNLNWCGFYLFDGQKLVLGPFQGKPACIYIPLNKGVCGKAATDRKSVRVDDVDAFPGHIACDSASKSEVVVPIIGPDQNLIGVLDVDSPLPNRFTSSDQIGLEKIVQLLVSRLSK